MKQFLDVLAITSEEFADTVAELEDLDIQYLGEVMSDEAMKKVNGVRELGED